MNQTPKLNPRISKRDGVAAQSGESHRAIKSVLETGLWLVATPIGNLSDFSARAIKTLAAADLILAEDTRMTRKLMALQGISGRVERCDEATTPVGLTKALEVLAQGGAVAFCSDAGTPGVSDPGARLAQGVLAAGYEVRAVPGASAVLTALTISGLPTGQFLFAGFVPTKAGARARFLADFASLKATLIFYETSPRLVASLSAMHDTLGDRPACVARELTKMYEEARRGRLSQLQDFYCKSGPPKGEIVIVVGGAPDVERDESDFDLDGLLRQAMQELTLRDAAAQVAQATGLPRRTLYNRALSLQPKRNANE